MTRMQLAAILALLLLALSCVCLATDSGDFIAALDGQLVFENSSADGIWHWHQIDFSGTGMETEQLSELEAGIFSKDKEWKLVLVKEQDTNGDGVIDWHDGSSLYLSHTDSLDKNRVNVPFPVRTCAWGTDHMTVACSFASSDVLAGEDLDRSGNSVVYLVDLESGELLRQLSDPAKTSWAFTLSPDGSKIALQVGTRTRTGRIEELETEGFQIVDVQTGELIYEISEPSAGIPSWSQNSRQIAFAAALEAGEFSEATIEGMYRDVFRVNLDDESHTAVNVTRTSRFSEVPACMTELGGISVSNPVWSPDGNAIAFVWRQDGSEQIWVTSVDGDERAQLTRKGHQYLIVEWHP